jgi:hypothetical protein
LVLKYDHRCIAKILQRSFYFLTFLSIKLKRVHPVFLRGCTMTYRIEKRLHKVPTEPVHHRKMAAPGRDDHPLFPRIDSASCEPRSHHPFRHLQMELKGVREIPETEGLMRILLGRGQVYRPVGEIKGLGMPLEDRKTRRESPKQRVVLALLG